MMNHDIEFQNQLISFVRYSTPTHPERHHRRMLLISGAMTIGFALFVKTVPANSGLAYEGAALALKIGIVLFVLQAIGTIYAALAKPRLNAPSLAVLRVLNTTQAAPNLLQVGHSLGDYDTFTVAAAINHLIVDGLAASLRLDEDEDENRFVLTEKGQRIASAMAG